MSPSRLFVRLPNWLGDLLMSRPLLHALRAALPAAHIAAVGPAAANLLARERLWDAFAGWPADPREAPEVWRGAHDLALVLPPSFSSAWKLPRGIPVRIGFAADLRSPLLTRAVKRPARGELHLSQEYLRLAESLGARSVPLPALVPTPEESAGARARLERLAAGQGRYAVLGPGAAYGPAKRWLGERFAALGRRLAGRGLAVLVCGAGADRAIAAEVAAAIGPGAHALAGETSLGEQLALCSAAAVTVTNDSGLAHLAAASGAPTVALFGSTSSAWTAPLGERVAVVQQAPVCSPCFRRDCRIGYTCLHAIEVDRVERACDEIAA